LEDAPTQGHGVEGTTDIKVSKMIFEQMGKATGNTVLGTVSFEFAQVTVEVSLGFTQMGLKRLNLSLG
jgi:hypothetical protein